MPEVVVCKTTCLPHVRVDGLHSSGDSGVSYVFKSKAILEVLNQITAPIQRKLGLGPLGERRQSG